MVSNLGKKALTNVATPLTRRNLPGLVRNLISNAINKFETKISGKGALRAGKRICFIYFEWRYRRFECINWWSYWNSKAWNKKSHAYEESGTQLRISFWHLLINFEKPEKLEFWKNEKSYWGFFCIKNHKHMRYNSWDKEWDKFVLSFWAIFYPLLLPAVRNHKKSQKCTIKWCMLTQVWSATDITFCHFRSFFALLPHYWPRKLIFGKNVKRNWRYYPFTQVHHKSRSYDAWFLRYKVQRTKFFVILGHFLPFCPPNNPKNQNVEKIKKILEILSFYTCVPQITIIWHMVPEKSSAANIIFGHFGLFFALLPH